MPDSSLLHELLLHSADRAPASIALTHLNRSFSYEDLGRTVTAFAAGMRALGVGRAERVAVYLDKRLEMVTACFGAAAAGAVFVPVNPLLKPDQVAYILRDCNVRVLVTSAERLDVLAPVLDECPDLRHVRRAQPGPSTRGRPCSRRPASRVIA